jgi:hypothetical protein
VATKQPQDDSYLGLNWAYITERATKHPGLAVSLFKIPGPDSTNLVGRIRAAAKKRGMKAWKAKNGDVLIRLDGDERR